MTWLKIFVLQLSPSDADIVTSDTAKIEEAKQEARKMNIAVLAVSLLYVLDIIFLYFFYWRRYFYPIYLF